MAYLGTLFEETLETDTKTAPQGRTVAQTLSGIAGVANIGSDRNWAGSHFDQANWYAYGRMAWNPQAKARDVATEWAALTFGPRTVTPVVDMMMMSRETVVNYMTPLGLHHIMGTGHHHGPAPWVDNLERPDWNPVYYHRASRDGIGFDRTAKGSNALEQYAPEIARQFSDPKTTPPQFLLWFHHLPWNYAMPSGRTLWAELLAHYDQGLADAKSLRARWVALKPLIDPRRYNEEEQRLNRQVANATLWRDACVAYFQSVSGLPLPAGVLPPAHPLDYYKSLSYPYAPGRG
jgi:alpha-glucuronidase